MLRRTIAIVFVVAAFGVATFLSVRSIRSSAAGSSNKDEILLVCEQCGHLAKLTSGQMLDTPRESTGRKCPACGAFRLVHATVPCAKCGKHLPYNPGLRACPWCQAPLGPSAPAPAGP